MAEVTVNFPTADDAIYFDKEIDRESTKALIQDLRVKERNFLLEQMAFNFPKPRAVTIYINSYGGSLTDSFAVVDVIHGLEIPTISVIQGAAASGATLISMACSDRRMTPHSRMLIHQLSSRVHGTNEEIQESARDLKERMEHIISFYASKTLYSKKELKEILKKDVWFNSKKCLADGLVHKIIS